MRQVTLHQLKVFEVAARHSSFTRAAEELYLTQPTVSMQIKQLTRLVGLPLFEQIGKKLYLTEAGRQLYATCQEIFAHLNRFDMTVADLKGLKQGRLSLAVVTTAKYIVPRLLGPFCRRYPGIDIALEVTNHDQIELRMAENRDDLYIMSQVPPSPELDARPFLENPLIVLAPRDHPLAGQTRIPLSQLANESFIMRESGSGTRRSVQKLFDRAGITLQVKMELAGNETIKQAIAGGLGISVLSRHTLALDGETHQFAILDVEGFPIANQWYVVTLKDKHPSIVATTFLEYLFTEGTEIARRAIAWADAPARQPVANGTRHSSPSKERQG